MERRARLLLHLARDTFRLILHGLGHRTGFGTGALPAVNLPDIVLPTLVLPSLGAGDLPPGSVTKPSPTAGPGGGPTTGQPTGDPTTLPTGVPTTGVPTAAVPTAGRPTAAATSAAVVLPSVDLTQLIDDLTGALDHARSACAASGLNDMDGEEGQNESQVQTAADSWKYYGLPKGAVGTWGLCRGAGAAD